ncbi:MAG: hypothetical protein ACKO96_46345, partial [Flammeovirgaceae bacterium]
MIAAAENELKKVLQDLSINPNDKGKLETRNLLVSLIDNTKRSVSDRSSGLTQEQITGVNGNDKGTKEFAGQETEMKAQSGANSDQTQTTQTNGSVSTQSNGGSNTDTKTVSSQDQTQTTQ